MAFRRDAFPRHEMVSAQRAQAPAPQRSSPHSSVRCPVRQMRWPKVTFAVATDRRQRGRKSPAVPFAAYNPPFGQRIFRAR